jgi:hypothetical protein
MDYDDRETYRTAINDILFWLFSDDQWSYYARFLLLFVAFVASFITLYFLDWRYWLLIPVAFIYSYLSAARYLKDLYELPDLQDALNYLLACSLSRNSRPSVYVDKGKLELRRDDVNLIDRIGGPGELGVNPGNLVLFEKLTGLSRVVGGGKHDIHRFEFVKEVVSLDEQYQPLKNVEAVTVDGIRVRVSLIHIRFKLRERESDWAQTYGEALRGDAYRGAVKNFAYNRLVSEEGFMTLNQMVRDIIERAVKKYINRHTIDQIITPDNRMVDSRQALKNELNGPEVRAQMKDIGARLVGLELGAFEFPDAPIDHYRLGKWKETKRGEIKVLEAEGRAYELSRQDAVRSKTQAEMIQGIINALEDLRLDDVEDLDALIKIRTAQILDTWSGLYSSDQKNSQNISRYLRGNDQEDERE